MTRLEQERRRRSMRQVDVAREAGLPEPSGQKFVSMLEHGYRPGRYSLAESAHLARVAAVFELTPRTLLRNIGGNPAHQRESAPAEALA
jgi:transcriptional regulator with XRE-family HTH domain